MKAPASGARVRMYRQGQGDCFLIAFPRQGANENNPVYLLIDCGIMNGSEIKEDVGLEEVIDHIHDATGGKIDYVAVTHEHADHVNGFNKKRDHVLMWDAFEPIGQLWLAWTEDGEDDFANQLRRDFGDTLVALAMAEERMRDLEEVADERQVVSQLLSLERDDVEDRDTLRKAGEVGLGTFAIDGITNKRAIKFLREKAEQGARFLRPGQPAFEIGGTDGALVYVMGPPRDKELLLSLDPRGDEEFHATGSLRLTDDFSGFQAVFGSGGVSGRHSPFAPRYATSIEDVKAKTEEEVAEGWKSEDADTEARVYAARTYEGIAARRDEAWRRIDGQWLAMSERMALRMNDEVNNTSLVLAFELPQTGKVLLFTGDAQRGNWMSWSDLTWDRPDGQTVEAKELLSRCVFYKCGHHGSHNATLNGDVDSDYANLSWLGTHAPRDEFVAMVPVHSDWARTEKRWNHPLPAIEDALKNKARGRVFLNDVERVRR
ncbi:MAG: MBL fold metallo-hydrolase, partial [Pseudomonadota bacterium]